MPKTVDEPITLELRAIADREHVAEPERSWRRFCGLRAGKRLHVRGAWQAWCANERNRAPPPRREPPRPRVVPRPETADERPVRATFSLADALRRLPESGVMRALPRTVTEPRTEQAQGE